MMNLQFKQQFVQAILSGTKIHTLRHGNNYRSCQPVEFLANHECFATGKILYVYNSFMRVHKDGGLSINNNAMVSYPGLLALRGFDCRAYAGTEDLAKNSGFANFNEFLNFFSSQRPGEYQLVMFELDKE